MGEEGAGYGLIYFVTAVVKLPSSLKEDWDRQARTRRTRGLAGSRECGGSLGHSYRRGKNG